MKGLNQKEISNSINEVQILASIEYINLVIQISFNTKNHFMMTN